MMVDEAAQVVRAEGFSFPQIVAATSRAGRRFIALIRSLDPADGAKPVPALEWDVLQTAAHVLGIVMRGTGDRRRAQSAELLGDLNLMQLTEVAATDLSAVADLLEDRLDHQLSALQLATGDEPFELHAGLHASVKTALSYELWDFLVHGMDIARATGARWNIDASDAALTLTAGLPALGPWVGPAVVGGPVRSAVVAFPGSSDAISLTVGAESYHVELRARDDAAVEVDPVELLIALSKRDNPSQPEIAELSSWYIPL